MKTPNKGADGASCSVQVCIAKNPPPTTQREEKRVISYMAKPTDIFHGQKTWKLIYLQSVQRG